LRVKAEPFVVIEDHGVAETARRTRGKLCRDLRPLVILGQWYPGLRPAGRMRSARGKTGARERLCLSMVNRGLDLRVRSI